jgi:nitronate monooxygenase
VGLPGRAIKNSFLNEVDAGMRKKFRCAWKCLEHCDATHTQYCISQALNNARLGKLAHGFTFAGANAYRVDHIVSVKTLMQELENEYSRMVDKETVVLRSEFEEAFKKLVLLKDEYLKTAQKNVRALKLDVEEILEKGNAAFHEEYSRALTKLDMLKTEYGKHLDKVNELKAQLSRFFDTSSLKLPTAAIS